MAALVALLATHRRSTRIGRVVAEHPRPGRKLANGARVSLVIGRR
jgi:hypothetical protein